MKKKYYPNVIQKLLWAYEQEFITVYEPLDTLAKSHMDDLKRNISIAYNIYFMEVDGYNITKRFARVMNDQFFQILDKYNFRPDLVKKCKRLTLQYTKSLFKINRKEAYYGRHK